MKVIHLEKPYIFSYIPLTYPDFDSTILLSLRNESTNIETNVICSQIQSKGRVYVTIPSDEVVFKDNDRYSIKINDYYGKLIVIKSGKSVQNYTNGNKYFK